MNLSKICADLLELIDQQERMIVKQNETIMNLVNDNAEKENAINLMLQKEIDGLPY